MSKAIRFWLALSALLALTFWAGPARAAEPFTLVSVVVGEGANIWLPSTLIVEKGDEVTLKLRNAANKDHGFTLEGQDVIAVVGAGETKEVTFKPAKRGVYRFYCHLHSAHIGGQLLVQ